MSNQDTKESRIKTLKQTQKQVKAEQPKNLGLTQQLGGLPPNPLASH